MRLKFRQTVYNHSAICVTFKEESID